MKAVMWSKFGVLMLLTSLFSLQDGTLNRAASQSVDTNTRQSEVSSSSREPYEGGKWTTIIRPSETDEGTEFTNFLRSYNKLHSKFTENPFVSLYITCRNGETDIGILFYEYMKGDEDEIVVTYKVDNNTSEIIKLTFGSHSGVGLRGNDDSLPFLKKLLGKRHLTISAKPFVQPEITAMFKIKGIEHATKPIAKACRWWAEN